MILVALVFKGDAEGNKRDLILKSPIMGTLTWQIRLDSEIDPDFPDVSNPAPLVNTRGIR